METMSNERLELIRFLCTHCRHITRKPLTICLYLLTNMEDNTSVCYARLSEILELDPGDVSKGIKELTKRNMLVKCSRTIIEKNILSFNYKTTEWITNKY